MIVYLIPSDDPRIQYFSFSLWVFLYSCPIPMSYLLNEKRVKEVIIKDGWIEGIKSGFHTSQQIRQQEILLLQKRDTNSESLRKNGEIDKTACVNELPMELVKDHKISTIDQIKICTPRLEKVNAYEKFVVSENYYNITNILNSCCNSKKDISIFRKPLLACSLNV